MKKYNDFKLNSRQKHFNFMSFAKCDLKYL